MSKILKTDIDPIQGFFKHAKEKNKKYPIIIALFIAFIAISVYFYVFSKMISTINNNTNKLLSKVGLEETPKLLHQIYLLAEIDNIGNLEKISGNNIEISDTQEIQLKYQGAYLISYNYEGNLIDNAYVLYNGTKIAQSIRSNGSITGTELFFTEKPNESIQFIINARNDGMGRFKMIYFGSIN